MRKSLLGAAVLGLLLSGCGIVQTTSHAHMKMDMARNTAVSYVPRVRTYYIAADEVLWDYAPDDRNDIAGRPWNDETPRSAMRSSWKYSTPKPILVFSPACTVIVGLMP